MKRILLLLIAIICLFSCEKPPQETEKEKGEGKETVIPVSSVTLNKTELSLVEGEEETLVATVKPDNAKDKSVVWESTDAKVHHFREVRNSLRDLSGKGKSEADGNPGVGDAEVHDVQGG